MGTLFPYSQMLCLCVVAAVFSILLYNLFTSVLGLHCCMGATRLVAVQGLLIAVASLVEKHGLCGA